MALKLLLWLLNNVFCICMLSFEKCMKAQLDPWRGHRLRACSKPLGIAYGVHRKSTTLIASTPARRIYWTSDILSFDLHPFNEAQTMIWMHFLWKGVAPLGLGIFVLFRIRLQLARALRVRSRQYTTGRYKAMLLSLSGSRAVMTSSKFEWVIIFTWKFH